MSISPITCPVLSSSLMHSTVMAAYRLRIRSLAITCSSEQRSEIITCGWYCRKYMLIVRPKSLSSTSGDSMRRPKLKERSMTRSGLSICNVRSSSESIFYKIWTPRTPSVRFYTRMSWFRVGCSFVFIWLEQCILTIVTIKLSMLLRIISEKSFSLRSFRLDRNCTKAIWRETENPCVSVSLIACWII